MSQSNSGSYIRYKETCHGVMLTILRIKTQLLKADLTPFVLEL